MINEFTEGIILMDYCGTIIECNEAAANQLGYLRTVMMESTIQELLYQGETEWNKILTVESKRKVLLAIRHGDDRCLEVNGRIGKDILMGQQIIYLIMDSVGEKDGLYGEEDDSYLQVQSSNHYLKNIYHPKLFEEYCSRIMDRLGAKTIGIYLYDARKKQFTLQASVGVPEEFISELGEFTSQSIIVGGVYLRHVPQNRLVRDYESLEIRKILNAIGVQRLKSYPIYFDEEILGVMTFGYADENQVQDVPCGVALEEVERLGLLVKSMYLNQQLSRELTQRLKVEAEIELFFKFTKSYVIIMDEDGRIKRMGNELKQLLGYEHREINNKYLTEIFDEDDQRRLMQWMKEIREENIHKEYWVEKVGSNGKVYWISWIGQYLYQYGIYLFSGRDISQLKETEERQRVLEQAVIRENIKNEFFTNISHEFRTPVNILLSAAQLIEHKGKRGLDAGEMQRVIDEYIPLIKQNSYRLLRLVNNLLDMTKIDGGYYQLCLGNHDIVSTVEDIVLSVAEYINSYEIKLIFDTDIEEKFIACDPDKIERIMLNLLSNGVKYASEGGLIEVTIIDGAEYITIVVQDNGAGMSPDQQQIIFGRFRQADSSLTRPREGTGIGLALVKSLVEMHQGTIEVESALGKGSKFTIRLPIVRLDDDVNCPPEKSRSLSNLVELCNIEFSDIYQ